MTTLHRTSWILAHLLLVSGFVAGPTFPGLAQSTDLVSCIQTLTGLGISPDQALQACQEQACPCDQAGSPITPTTPEQTAPAPAATSSESVAADALTDISGVFGETEIKQLVDVGIIELASPQFRPEDPITRGEFITWLVRAFNLYHPERQMRFGTSPNFSDTVSDAPYSRYLGAIQDAGYVVGFEDGTFRPNQNLNREQMIAIKNRLDSQNTINESVESLRNRLRDRSGFVDADDVDTQFLSFVVTDTGSSGGRNFQRVYGTTQNYRPKQVVTRAEAAVALTRIGNDSSYRTVGQALRRLGR